MALIGYNRRLAWVVVPLVLWALLGLSMAFGIGWRESAGQPPLRMGIGPAEGHWWLYGGLAALSEDGTGLRLELVIPGGKQPLPLPELPPDVSVEYVQAERRPQGPPDIHVPGEERVFKLPGQQMLVVGDLYIVSFSPEKVHIFKRPVELDRERLKQFLRKQRAKPVHPPNKDQPPRPLDRLRERLQNRPPKGQLPPPPPLPEHSGNSPE